MKILSSAFVLAIGIVQTLGAQPAQNDQTSPPGGSEATPALTDSVRQLRAALERVTLQRDSARSAYTASEQTRAEQLAASDRRLAEVNDALGEKNTAIVRLSQAIENANQQAEQLRATVAIQQLTIDTVRLNAATARLAFIDSIRTLGTNTARLRELLGTAETAATNAHTQAQTQAKISEQNREEFLALQKHTTSLEQNLKTEQQHMRDLQLQQSEIRLQKRLLQDSIVKIAKQRAEIQRQLDGPGRFLLYAAILLACVVGCSMLWLGYGLYRHGTTPLLTPSEKSEYESAAGKGTFLLPETIIEVARYRCLSRDMRKVLIAQILASGLLLAVTIGLVAALAPEPIKLIGEDGFWKVLAGIAVPLGFVTAAFNAIESRSVEAIKLLCELRNKTTSN